MSEPQQGFILRDKVEGLVAEIHKCLNRYPKCERHVLAAETRSAGYRLLRSVISAGKVKEKRRWLDLADADIAVLNGMLRIGMQLEYLPFPNYERLVKQIDEVGKILGAWIKKI